MFLSVIIPTRNRASMLKKALLSLKNQTLSKNFEIIIVDNGSTDETRNISYFFENKFLNFKYLYEPNPGLHSGRHAGLAASNGDILAYIDDDIEAPPVWLEGIINSFKNPNVALVGGNNYPIYECSPQDWMKKLWTNTPYGYINGIFSLLDFGKKCKIISPQYVWGCNFSIRKDILLEVGGFHPDGFPDNLLKYRGDGETAISNKIEKTKYVTFFNPNASVFHHVPRKRMTFDYVYRRGYLQGISDSYTNIRDEGGLLNYKLLQNNFFYIKYRANQFLFNLKSKQFDPLTIYQKGWWAGYFFHQSEAKRDKLLLNWILQEDYFGPKGILNQKI